jgi:hypothetical protein
MPKPIHQTEKKNTFWLSWERGEDQNKIPFALKEFSFCGWKCQVFRLIVEVHLATKMFRETFEWSPVLCFFFEAHELRQQQ